MSLTPGQLGALRNLALKQGGGDVEWISIAHARALGELGLAVRTGDGWRITPAGNAALAQGPAADATPSTADLLEMPRSRR